jgi:hypothetical protein
MIHKIEPWKKLPRFASLLTDVADIAVVRWFRVRRQSPFLAQLFTPLVFLTPEENTH